MLSSSGCSGPDLDVSCLNPLQPSQLAALPGPPQRFLLALWTTSRRFDGCGRLVEVPCLYSCSMVLVAPYIVGNGVWEKGEGTLP